MAFTVEGFEAHESVTLDRVMAASSETTFGLSSLGLCLACGVSAVGVEPDARRYPCSGCGSRRVYGADELLLYIVP